MNGFWTRWLLRIGVCLTATAPLTPYSLVELQRLGLPIPEPFEAPWGAPLSHDIYFQLSPVFYLTLILWIVPFLASFEGLRAHQTVAMLSVVIPILMVMIAFAQVDTFSGTVLVALCGAGFVVPPVVLSRRRSLMSGARLARLLLGIATMLVAVMAAFPQGWRMALWFGSVSLFFGGLAIATAEILWKSPIPSAGDTMGSRV